MCYSHFGILSFIMVCLNRILYLIIGYIHSLLKLCAQHILLNFFVWHRLNNLKFLFWFLFCVQKVAGALLFGQNNGFFKLRLFWIRSQISFSRSCIYALFVFNVISYRPFSQSSIWRFVRHTEWKFDIWIDILFLLIHTNSFLVVLINCFECSCFQLWPQLLLWLWCFNLFRLTIDVVTKCVKQCFQHIF